MRPSFYQSRNPIRDDGRARDLETLLAVAQESDDPVDHAYRRLLGLDIAVREEITKQLITQALERQERRP